MSTVSRNPRPADMPAAVRSRTSGWRDPRLWIGLVLVAGSVVAGARILGQADDTVAVWAAATELQAGHVLTADDLTATRLRFADATDAERYLGVDDTLPDELELVRPLGQGELVPVGALGAGSDEEVVEVSVALPADGVPTGLEAGSRVDVWVVGEDGRGRTTASIALSDVAVVAAPRAAESFASSGSARQVVLAVPSAAEGALATVLAASSDGAVRIVGRG